MEALTEQDYCPQATVAAGVVMAETACSLAPARNTPARSLWDDLDGELSPEMEALLTELQGAEAVKLDAYYGLIQHAEMEAAAANAEANRWARRADRRSSFVEGVKRRILEHLVKTGSLRVDTVKGHTFRIQKNGGKLPLDLHLPPDLDTLPAQFVKLVKQPDEAIRHALAGGEELEFARFGDRGQHLRII